MDYKKIIIYIVIILAGLGYWYGRKMYLSRNDAYYDRIAGLYAETAVMAEIHRLQPETFVWVRDSLYRHYQLTPDAYDSLQQELIGREEEWGKIWGKIKKKTDSLVKYYQDSLPQPPPPDTTRAIKPPAQAQPRVGDSL